MPDPIKLSEENRAKLDGIVSQMVSNKESDDDIQFVVEDFKNKYAVKKKESSVSTSTTTPSNSVLDGGTVSSDIPANSGFPEAEIDSPIPDYTKMTPANQPVKKNNKSVISNSVKKETSFYDYLKENLDSGLATVSKSIYDTPGYIYDVAASITNPIVKGLTGYKGEGASSDKLANDLGFKNIPSEVLQEKIKKSNDKINEYAAKNGGDAFAALENGNYVNAAKLVTGTTVQSLPIMIAAMASGGETMALSAIGLSTASTKNAELKESNPEMGLGTRVSNAANSGIIEAVTGHLFTGASGAVIKRILAEKGAKQGAKIISKSLKSTIEKSIEKNPLISALGEVIEESAVEFGNQLNDMSSGIRTEFDIHAIKNAGLSATGMGGLQTLGVYGAKGYVKSRDYAKLKATNREVFKLRNEVENGNLSDENKTLLTQRADRLEEANKKLLGTEIEKVKALPTEVKTELNALNQEFESLKSKFDDIDDADDIPDNLKPAMKEEIKIQASKNQKRKTEILSQNDGLEVDNDFSNFEGVEPDFNLENGKISSLPLKEQDRLNKLAVEQITGGDKTIEYTKEQVSQKANEIYTNEQTPPTSETKPQAEVPQQAEAEKVAEFPLLEGETLIDKKADSKGNIHTTVALTTEKDGRKKTKFLFNRSDKDAGQRNMTSISPEKLSSDFGFEISKDDVPEGFEVTRVKEIRETDKGSGATVTIKNIENNESWDADIVITKSKPQEVSPVEDVVVAPSVEKSISLQKNKEVNSNLISHINGKEWWRTAINEDAIKERGLFLASSYEEAEFYGKPENKPFAVNVKNPLIGSEEFIMKELGIEFSRKEVSVEEQFKIDSQIKQKAEDLGYDSVALMTKKGFENYQKTGKIPKSIELNVLKNEATSPTNTSTDGVTAPGVEPDGTQGENNSVPEAVDAGTSEGKVEVKEENSNFIPKKETIKDDKGNPISFYHGTESEFTDFDESKLGSFTGADSAKEGFFFTNNKNVANSYRQQSIYDKPNTEGLKAILSNMHKEEIAEIGQKLLNNDAKYYYGDMTKQERIDDILVDVIKDTESESYYPDRNKYIEKVAKILKEKGVELKPYLDNGQVIETHLDIKNPKIIDAKGDIASDFGLTKILKEAKSEGHDGVIIKNIYDSVSFEEKGNDTELSDIVVVFDKKQINIKNKPAETPKPKSKADAEVNDLDHAKSEIDKGVLQWNGDMGAERINLGITWADIRKGQKDILAGKENTVPAKRLIEALKIAKQNGGYEYVQGSGGQMQKQFVSLEDIQRVSNENNLTDAELETINKNEEVLAKEHEDYFNSLDEASQQDILENYENREDNSGEIQRNSEVGEGKNDVSNEEKTGTGENGSGQEKINDTFDSESFRDSWNKEPESGELNQYDSANTIEREHGTPRNNQTYEVQKDLARVQIGIKALQHAKELFGDEYVEKTLSFIEQANLGPEKKAVAYVLLENEMDARTKANPKNLSEQKLQDLVRAKSQAFLANSARAIGAGRFRIERYRELVKKGFSEEDFTNTVFTTKQIENREKIKKLLQVTPEDVNNEFDRQESAVVEDKLEQMISEGVEKQINEIYKKLPTNRRIKAEKAITALENIQKKLRGKAYDASIGIPVAILDSGITIIKNSIKAGVNIADAIELGINHIKSKYGKNWEKEDDFRNDMRNGFEGEGVSIKERTPKEKTQEQKAKEVVKKALIEKGFGREVNVRTKEGRETREYLDWKKLAGEEGSVEKIRKNVEEALKDKGYSKSKISEIKSELENEYVRLSADVINKGLRELENRNTPRKPSELKSAARKLAELNNYGLFEENKDSYENIINNVLGINELDKTAFDGMKEIAKGYATLMDSGYSEIAMKGAINELSRKQARLLSNASFLQASKGFQIMTALAEITNLSTRFKLVNLGNLNENISSGIMARVYNDLTDAFVNTTKKEDTKTKALKEQSSKNAKAKLKGIVFEAAESYGDTSSLLLSHSKIEDYFNESTTNKAWHALLSSYMGRPVLEGADSFNKILLTEAKIRNSAIRILQKKGMSNKEALDYVSKALTGESMEDAKVKAKELINTVNEKAGRKILNDSQTAIESLASDIVKDALVSGGQMTDKELEAVYNASYKSAGRDIGHVSNNKFTDQISLVNSSVENKITNAIKEKDWSTAAYYTGQQIIFRNFIYTFVGGGTNWFVKGLQKAGNPLSLVSLYDDVKLKAGKELDITSDEGIKNMEKVLYRDMNIRSTAGTIAIGALNTLLMFSALKASGLDDDLNEWLKKNIWAKKYFDKMAPDVVVAMLAYENKEMGRYFSKMINQKPDFFDDQKNIQKILDNYTKGYVEKNQSKTDKASGMLGGMLGSRFDIPGPLKLAQDFKQVYKGIVDDKYEPKDYYSSGFWNGFLKGGITEEWGLRPEPNTPEGSKKRKRKTYNPEGNSEKSSEQNLEKSSEK